MDFPFLYQTFLEIITGIPLTLQLAVGSVLLGFFLALGLALMQLSGNPALRAAARTYVLFFRGTPLLVQLFLIYYGLGQFPWVRESVLWPLLREPYWCALLSLTLCTGAYASEIIRGGLQSVPQGQIEAARACGMPSPMIFKRIVFPLAIRQALPAYGNELISMIKSTSLASIITLMEITGIAARIIAETYRALEVFLVAGAIYLFINLILTRLLLWAEFTVTPHLRAPGAQSATKKIKKLGDLQ
ncbi:MULTISPECIES: ABC transporter permease [Brenneria]|uniref:Arginine ABC transporter permease protein ArtM n=1 Tax=Brenneria nigrifluens DSM 30175 = ATCC 13028 TaxID=1121120 RepID=A0A2U1UTD5_9GAMM|nr:MULTISPECIES: ABC transporter permease [Brenneria]EHD19852.1 polar amino acid ABC transporter, inner membrane subunit [Brenneria sp. EniD312]PWC24900.1 ABC transporter permease [Brenneria nigrifluens] [Brenneria nigrifluens DSM 30175 = ATCC 13028]QCR03106.1 ABC transporter permease [Brenneria nigrifluens] [Brenneria nigrifluens DSM 30175 = ATCC 13028]